MDKKPHIKPYLYGMLAGFGAISLSIIFFFFIYRFEGFGDAVSKLTSILMPFIYGAVIAYSSILAQEKDIMAWLPYFYICLVAGMLVSKLSTKKVIDAGEHKALVFASIVVLILTMLSFLFLETGLHLLIAGFFFGLGYGIL